MTHARFFTLGNLIGAVLFLSLVGSCLLYVVWAELISPALRDFRRRSAARRRRP